MKPFNVTLALIALIATPALHASGPLKLSVSGRPDGLKVELSSGPSFSLPRPAPPLYLGLQVFHSGSEAFSLHTLIRGRLWDVTKDWAPETVFLPQHWRTLEGAGRIEKGLFESHESARVALEDSLPERFRLELEVLEGPDLTLIFGDQGLRQGVAAVLRIRQNDCSWASVQDGVIGGLRELRPIRGLSAASEARRLLGLLLILLAKAAALALALAALAWVWPKTAASSSGVEWKALPQAWLLPAAAFCLAAWVGLWGFEGLPHVSDEIAFIFQAKAMLGGHLRAALPGPPEFFGMENVFVGPAQWWGKYPPLWPATLAVFLRTGLLWAAGPAFLALSVALLAAFARRADGRAVAVAAAGLLAFSPQVMVMSASFFNHSAALALTLAFLWAVWTLDQEASLAPWAAAALSAAALAAMRPFTAACVAGPAALWLLWRRRRARDWAGLAAVAAAMALAYGLSNWIATGQGLLSPYQLYDPNDRLGFGPSLGSLWSWGSPGHDLAKALANTRLYVEDLSHRLFGWPGGLCLGLVLINFWLRKGGGRLDWLLAGTVLALAGGHLFYWCLHLATHGAFYWHEGLASLAWLSARGAWALAERLRRHGLPGRRAVAAALGLGMAWSLFHYLPPRVMGLRGFAQVDGTLARVTAPLRGGPCLVFVRQDNPMTYHTAFALQDPYARGRFLYARDRGEDNARLAALHPQRRPLLWDGRSLRPWSSSKTSSTASRK